MLVRALRPSWSFLDEYPVFRFFPLTGTTRAGIEATACPRLAMLSSTFGPSPFHSTVYVPGANCCPCTLSGSISFNVPLVAGAAKAPLTSNNDARVTPNRLLETFISQLPLIFLAKGGIFSQPSMKDFFDSLGEMPAQRRSNMSNFSVTYRKNGTCACALGVTTPLQPGTRVPFKFSPDLPIIPMYGEPVFLPASRPEPRHASRGPRS